MVLLKDTLTPSLKICLEKLGSAPLASLVVMHGLLCRL